MRFTQLRGQNFRNFEFAELDLQAERTFLLGANGQGKSNLLEALGLVTALRSFRTQNASVLPRRGFRDFALSFDIEHEQQGPTQLDLAFQSGQRRVSVDGEPVNRLSDFIGRFPTVTLCSTDLMLLRGSPGERRRFLDLTLSVADRDYYRALRHFHRGVAERNRLLKKGGSAAQLSAFEAEMATAAALLMERREAGLQQLDSVLRRVYAAIAEADEGPRLTYQSNVDCREAGAYRELLAASRERDQLLGATQKGPHRDDCGLALDVGGARDYASDGQQRGLCVALRIAQAVFYHERLGILPVVLADDVLGELDPHRREGFWRACPSAMQLIATGTEAPTERAPWRMHMITGGAITPGGSPPVRPA